MLLLRFSISQMAAAGVTSIARSVGAAISPSLTGVFLAAPSLLSLPFILSGGFKLAYDALLYRNFRALAPPEEKEPEAGRLRIT